MFVQVVRRFGQPRFSEHCLDFLVLLQVGAVLQHWCSSMAIYVDIGLTLVLACSRRFSVLAVFEAGLVLDCIYILFSSDSFWHGNGSHRNCQFRFVCDIARLGALNNSILAWATSCDNPACSVCQKFDCEGFDFIHSTRVLRLPSICKKMVQWSACLCTTWVTKCLAPLLATIAATGHHRKTVKQKFDPCCLPTFLGTVSTHGVQTNCNTLSTLLILPLHPRASGNGFRGACFLDTLGPDRTDRTGHPTDACAGGQS